MNRGREGLEHPATIVSTDASYETSGADDVLTGAADILTGAPHAPDQPSPALARIILEHTVIASPHLCPEIQLRLITPACPLWRATAADLERLGLEDPFWGFCWPGGQVLARYLIDHPEVCRGRRVLDFGAGCGVEAMAAGIAGAGEVLAADIDPLAAEACRLNAALNHVRLEATSRDLIGLDEGWEVVLAGDMFYETSLAVRVLAWLEALAARGATVLVGDPRRGFLPAGRVRILEESVLVGDPRRGFLPAGRVRILEEYLAPSDVDVDGRYLRPASVLTIGG